MDKKTAGISYEEVLKKSQDGQGLTLMEASVRYGIAYSTLCDANKNEGLPLFGGKLFEADFIRWRQERAGMGAPSSQSAGARRRRETAGTPYVYP